MTTLEALRSIQFVMDKSGKPSAVQMTFEAWEELLNWLEDVEDRAIVRNLLAGLRAGPKQTEALRWQDVRDDWQ
jgi:hypothetical protein